LVSKINLLNNKFARAFYFLQESHKHNSDKNTSSLLKKAQAGFFEEVKDYKRSKKNVDVSSFHKNASLLKIENHNEMEKFLLLRQKRCRLTDIFLELHWAKNEYVPINRMEHAKKLAEFLGKVKVSLE